MHSSQCFDNVPSVKIISTYFVVNGNTSRTSHLLSEKQIDYYLSFSHSRHILLLLDIYIYIGFIMGNIIADFEINEVEESDIQQVESELTAIKGTDVDKASRKVSPSSSVENYVDISDTKDCIESNLSSPTEYHSARNSEHFPFTDSDVSDIESEDQVASRKTDEKSVGNNRSLFSTESETSGDFHENCRVCQQDMYDLLNPDDLSNTGSEVSDFDSDFDLDITGADSETPRHKKTSAGSDSDPTIENVSSQSLSDADNTPNKQEPSSALLPVELPSEQFTMGGNSSPKDTSGSCCTSENPPRNNESSNENNVLADESQESSCNKVTNTADDNLCSCESESMGAGASYAGVLSCDCISPRAEQGGRNVYAEERSSPSYENVGTSLRTSVIESQHDKGNCHEDRSNCQFLKVNYGIHSENGEEMEKSESSALTDLKQDENVDHTQLIGVQKYQDLEKRSLMGAIQISPTTENDQLLKASVDKDNMDEYPSMIWDIVKNHQSFADLLTNCEHFCSFKLDLLNNEMDAYNQDAPTPNGKHY